MMTSLRLLFLTSLLLCAHAGLVHAETTGMVVIVNHDSKVTALSKKHVMGLFLGRSRSFPAGGIAKAFDLPVDSKIRQIFFEQLTGKSISDIDAYWARLRYSGRANPPKALDDSAAIVSEVSSNASAIAYVSQAYLNSIDASSVKVVYRLEL